jgi:hypothetical protein
MKAWFEAPMFRDLLLPCENPFDYYKSDVVLSELFKNQGANEINCGIAELYPL